MQSKEVKLLYGRNGINLNLKDHWNADIIRKPSMPIINDIKDEVNNALNILIYSQPIDEICIQDQSFCFLVCDVF